MIDSILPFIAAHFLLGYGLACLPSASTSLRGSILCLIIVCCFVSVRSSVSQWVPGLIGNDYVIGFILHASNFLLIARLSPPEQALAWHRVKWTANQLFDARWNARYIPLFDSKDPNRIPSRYDFIVRRSVESICLCAIIWILHHYRLNILPQDFFDVPDGFLRRLSSVDGREITIRIYVYFTALFVSYCTLRLAHSLSSVLAVLCGDTPARWRPLFGNIGEAYTVRRFYALFWHQLMRKAFTSHAILIVKLIPGLSSTKLLRHLILFVSFLIVALMHIFTAANPTLCLAWPQIRYYGSTALAILVEDIAIGLWGQIDINAKGTKAARSAKKGSRESSKEVIVQGPKVSKFWPWVGYVWVMSFDMWATSKLVYATTQCR